MALNITKPPTEVTPEEDLEFLRKKISEQQEKPLIKKLSKHLDVVWEQVKKDNKETRRQMVKTLKRIKGEYEAEKLSAIKAFKGSEIFVRSSEAKARAAVSWVQDIYKGDVDLPWILSATEIPDLPDEKIEEITQQTQAQIVNIQQELAIRGIDIESYDVSHLVNDYYDELLDKAKKDLSAEANERVKRAESLIRDQTQEGGWTEAFNDFLYYFVRLKFGVIKGPILTKKKKQIWQRSESGSYELQSVDVLVNDVYCVSPFNFYPVKGIKSVNDGDIIEVHELSKQSIHNLIGVPGYSEQELRTVLNKLEEKKLKPQWLSIEDETQVKQATQDNSKTQATTPVTQNAVDFDSDLVQAIEFYGTVSGALLTEWGYEEPLEPTMQYQVNCWKIGEHVIKAVINPDSLGRKPYHVSSWAKNPAWLIGEGMVEFAAPIEDAMNAVLRALQNNIGIASGPLCEIDKDRVDMKTPLYPWRQIESTSKQMTTQGPAVNYYQPQMHANELILAYQFFGKLLDEMTVPAYAQGASQAGVTAGTATVFTQLLAAASRSIKAVVSNIDEDIIVPFIQMSYDFNMRTSEDQAIKGDARVVAQGVTGLQAREQAAQRKVEFLQVISNPTYQEILGAENIGSILGQIAKSNDIKLPDMNRLDGGEQAQLRLESLLNAQAGYDPNQANGQMSAGGGAPRKPQGQNADGSKAGVNNG